MLNLQKDEYISEGGLYFSLSPGCLWVSGQLSPNYGATQSLQSFP